MEVSLGALPVPGCVSYQEVCAEQAQLTSLIPPVLLLSLSLELLCSSHAELPTYLHVHLHIEQLGLRLTESRYCYSYN